MPVDATAVVTGAGSERGIGRAAARHLAAAGWNVAVLDIDGEAAAKSAAALSGEYGLQIVGLQADVTEAGSVDTAVREIEQLLPPLRALVNNAGVTGPTSFQNLTQEEWDRVFRVNVQGTFLMTQRVMPGMIEAGYGRIVNLSSVSAQRGGGVFGGVHYSAAKAAIQGLTRALAREVAATGVTVNAVAPGLIDTDITAGKLQAEAERAVLAGIPMRRKGTVDEVAAVIAFLASDEASYVTGATYDINGGSHIH